MCLLTAGLAAGQNPFRGDKGPNYQTFKDPAGRFELDYPTKDWRPLSTGGSSLAVFTSKDGPTLVIDHVTSDRAADAGGDRGHGGCRNRQAQGRSAEGQGLQSRTRSRPRPAPESLIRYTRDGSPRAGRVQGSVPVGRDLFRLNGVIPEKQVAKFESVIVHMIQVVQCAGRAVRGQELTRCLIGG